MLHYNYTQWTDLRDWLHPTPSTPVIDLDGCSVLEVLHPFGGGRGTLHRSQLSSLVDTTVNVLEARRKLQSTPVPQLTSDCTVHRAVHSRAALQTRPVTSPFVRAKAPVCVTWFSLVGGVAGGNYSYIYVESCQLECGTYSASVGPGTIPWSPCLISSSACIGSQSGHFSGRKIIKVTSE